MVLKFKKNVLMHFFLTNMSFSLHKMLIDGLQCVWIIVMIL